MKNIHIISGGTISYIRPHLALSAPAYGTTGEIIYSQLRKNHLNKGTTNANHIHYHGTKMTGGYLETNEDISKLLDRLIDDPNTGMIFMPVALCDFEVYHIDDGPRYDGGLKVGKEFQRLKTSDGQRTLMIKPAKKLLGKIRKDRKDIFLVAFKTTSDMSDDEMFDAGMSLLKKNSCNLVLVNDIKRRQNMILTPEMARYCVTTNRDLALQELVSMAEFRSNLTFNRTNVVENVNLIGWESDGVPSSLREVVNYCVQRGAYKPFNNVTVGHFGVLKKQTNNQYLYSSRRKKNYLNLKDRDLVLVTFNKDKITAYGDKPSAGVRSQYELFKNHPEYDCVVHFHCPLKDGSKINIRPQKQFECGSLECGINTSNGIMPIHDGLAAVMLDKHGPNILFKSNIDPQKVIKFIDDNFELSKSTSDSI